MRSIGSITLAAAIAVSFTLAMPVPVQAQGLFDFLGSIFRGSAPRAYNREPPRLLENFPGEDLAPPATRSSTGPRMAYCVRTCDGRFYPLPADAGKPSMTPAQLCSAMCPAAKTELYFGSEIDHAVTQRGRSYAKSENAFLYHLRALAPRRPGEVEARIGPAIGGCCYEVPAELADEVAAAHPAARATTTWGTPALDLPAAVAAQLHEAGVERVERAGVCTRCGGEGWFSHRRDPGAGRQAGVVVRAAPGRRHA